MKVNIYGIREKENIKGQRMKETEKTCKDCKKCKKTYNTYRCEYFKGFVNDYDKVCTEFEVKTGLIEKEYLNNIEK